MEKWINNIYNKKHMVILLFKIKLICHSCYFGFVSEKMIKICIYINFYKIYGYMH